jgi:phosphatidylglycerol lysyltransferase
MIRHRTVGHGLRFLQLAISLLIGAGCIWTMTGQLSAGFWQEVVHELSSLPPAAILLAAMCTALSFLAVGRYDAVAHRHFGTRLETWKACGSGTIAIALAQTLGVGLITGAVARWRMLPDITMPTALRLSAFVCLTFMAALLIVAAAACLLFPAPAFTFWPALAVLTCVPIAAAAMFFYPVIRVARREFRMPSLLAFGSIMIWTALDVGAASAALYLLIPANDVAYTVLLPLFLCALIAALLSGTPGGVGPFELVFLTFLPEGASAQVLAGIIAFRAVYYAVPALVAMGCMLRPFARQSAANPAPNADIGRAIRSEVGVIRQNGGYVQGQSALWPTGQTLCALFDPIMEPDHDPTHEVARAAHDSNRIAILYKCAARTALRARQKGWFVSHIADEAVLVPTRFDTASAPYRNLRRKLRAAEKSGVKISSAKNLPLSDMVRIDQAWCNARGDARGGTMGRFCPDYLSYQHVFLAHQGGRLVGFASFHHTPHEWCLDLMRHDQDIPDGTMHHLVHAAIDAAARCGVERLSLAAVPACPDPTSAIMVRLAQFTVQKCGGPGLRQFKSSFRPHWQPLYAAAPNRTLLMLGLADIARAVYRPSRLTKPDHPHHGDENYEVASRLAS